MTEWFDDTEPITRDWLLAIGFQPEDDDHFDYLSRGLIELYEYSEGDWRFTACDSVEIKTRGKLRQLMNWLDDPGPFAVADPGW